MPKQVKRGALGRPPKRTEAVQHTTIDLPVSLIDAIDAIRGGKSRTAIIEEAIRSHEDVAYYLRYGHGEGRITKLSQEQ